MFISLFLCIVIHNLPTAFSASEDIYRSKTSDEYVPCDSGWYYFRDKCYTVAGRRLPERFTWTRALNLCRGYGADLVSIQSQEEQNFVVAYLQLDVKWYAWTGLNDRDKKGDFRWSDGSVFNYSNWNPNGPSGKGRNGEDENCVHLLFEPADDAVGKWNDRSCDTTEYALCEKNANRRKRSPNLKYCSPEEGGGWRYGTSCYHIVMERMSWQNAERHCKNNYNGHLLTIRDTLEDLFLELALPDIEKDIWIGIKVKDRLQQKWTSGWYVSYERFNKEEGYTEGTCVARKSRKEWVTIPCSTQLPFICELSKAKPPVLKPAPEGSYCSKELDDWRDFGGEYCYYIHPSTHINFYDANLDCQRRRGNLVSIHSKEEADILQPFVKYTGYSIYIGLIRLKENNEETFGWTDGSKMDYQNWGHSEPNRLDEKCVEALTSSMVWRDISCDNKHSGYICSVKKITPRASLVDKPDNCANFCIAPSSYLFGVISQCEEARRIS